MYTNLQATEESKQMQYTQYKYNINTIETYTTLKKIHTPWLR